MTITNSTFRFFLEKLGDEVASTFVGHEGDIFYDPNTGILRLSDGNTPGGVPITQGASSITFDPTNYYTRAAVDGLFANLLGTADAQGDTLGELQALIAAALPLSGGTMSGPIYYAPLPIGVSELTNKGYVDSKIAAELATALGSLTTSLVPEGTNLYYTEARATANFTVNIADPMKTIGLVRTVNGVSPDTTGAISLSLTTTETGDFASRPATSNNGTLYVVSGDANTDLNGDAYIWTGNTTSGTWEVVAPSDTSTNDARYVQLAGSTMQGPLIAAADPVANLEFATKQYVDNQPLGMHGDVDLTTTPPVAGQALTYNGTDWVPATPAAKLGDLLDVSNTAPGTGFVLGWDVANNEWMPIASAAAPTIASLLDTDVVGAKAPTEGATLVYNANTAFWETQPKGENVIPMLPAGGHGWGRFHAYGDTLYRAGSNNSERIHAWGESTDTYASLPIPTNVQVSGWKKIWDQISAEYALSEEGWLFTAGDDDYGQQGTGSWAGRPVNDAHAQFVRNESPEIYGPGIEVLDVWGHDFTRWESAINSLWVHVDDNGTKKLYAAGYNGYGVLGVGGTTHQGALVNANLSALDGKGILRVHAHSDSMMLVTDDGEAWGAGYNANRPFGIDFTGTSSAIDRAKLSAGATDYVTGAVDVQVEFVTGIGVCSFILLADGRVLSCGTNMDGSLGNGSLTTDKTYFSEVLTAAGTPITDVVEIQGAGRGQIFMKTSTGDVWATGRNHDNVFGNATYPGYTGNEYAVLIQTGIDKMFPHGANRAGWCSAHWLTLTGEMYASGSSSDYVLGVAGRNFSPVSEWLPFTLPNNEKISQLIRLGGLNENNTPYLGVAVVSDAGNHYVWGQNGTPAYIPHAGDHTFTPKLVNDYRPTGDQTIINKTETILQTTVPYGGADVYGPYPQGEHVIPDYVVENGDTFRISFLPDYDSSPYGTYTLYRNGNDILAMVERTDGNRGGEKVAIGNYLTTLSGGVGYSSHIKIDTDGTIVYNQGDNRWNVFVVVEKTSSDQTVNIPQLAQIGDVDALAPADGEALVFDAATSTWKPGAVAAGSSETAEFSTVGLSAANNTLGGNATIPLDVIIESNGIPFDVATSTWSLKGGSSYKLEANIYADNFTANTSYVTYRFSDTAGNSVCGDLRGAATADGSSVPLTAIYSPTVDTDIRLSIATTSGLGTFRLRDDFVSATVTKIASGMPLLPQAEFDSVEFSGNTPIPAGTSLDYHTFTLPTPGTYEVTYSLRTVIATAATSGWSVASIRRDSDSFVFGESLALLTYMYANSEGSVETTTRSLFITTTAENESFTLSVEAVNQNILILNNTAGGCNFTYNKIAGHLPVATSNLGPKPYFKQMSAAETGFNTGVFLEVGQVMKLTSTSNSTGQPGTPVVVGRVTETDWFYYKEETSTRIYYSSGANTSERSYAVDTYGNSVVLLANTREIRLTNNSGNLREVYFEILTNSPITVL